MEVLVRGRTRSRADRGDVCASCGDMQTSDSQALNGRIAQHVGRVSVKLQKPTKVGHTRLPVAGRPVSRLSCVPCELLGPQETHRCCPDSWWGHVWGSRGPTAGLQPRCLPTRALPRSPRGPGFCPWVQTRVDTSLLAVACACGGRKDRGQDTPAETLTVGSALPSSDLVSLLLGNLGP